MSHRRPLAAAALLTVALAAPAPAGPPAAIPAAGGSSASKSFQAFAAGWMQKLERLESDNRRSPTPSGNGAVSYRGYGEEFTTEVKPTGRPQVPYVGLLRYREHVYHCSDGAARRCAVQSSLPVTEIFRYQDGRWVY